MKTEDLQNLPSNDEITPEQELFFIGMIKYQNRGILKAIKSRMNNGLTLEDILQEIKEKRSPLSANQRTFMQSLKLDFIQKLIDA